MYGKKRRDVDKLDEFPVRSQMSRTTVGFLINWLGGIYQSELWKSIVQAAKLYDVNLISFAGGDLKSPYGYISQSNVLYDLVSSDNVDGLVIAAGSISTYVGYEYIREFCQKFQSLPVVSISLELNSIPSVLVDSKVGMRAAIEHLMQKHHVRRIAFIRGPEGNLDANDRYSAYLNLLDKYNIVFNPKLVLSGDYSIQSGMIAARHLLAQNVSFEAVVAANDAMAFGAQEEFQKHGLNIPSDYTLIGFDNTEEAQYNIPPLTTVHLPIRELATKAIELIVAQLNGEDVPSSIVLPTQLVIRQSCGCVDTTIENGNVHNIRFVKEKFRTDIDSHRSAILDQMAKPIQPLIEFLQSPEFNHNEQLLDTLVDELHQPANSHEFLATFRHWAESIPLTRYSMEALQGIISVLRHNILQHIRDEQMHHQAENIFQNARIFIGNLIERQQAMQRLKMRSRNEMLRELEHGILSTFELSELSVTLRDKLSYQAIDSCFIALYENPLSPPRNVRLIFAYHDKEQLEINPEREVFPAKQLLPEGILVQPNQFSIVVEALYFREEQIGYVVFGMDLTQDAGLYTVLRQQLSNAIKGALLVQEQRQTATELARHRDHLEQLVEERTVDLHAANEKLVQENAERTKAEAEVRRLNAQLEELVEQRTAELTIAYEHLTVLSQAKDEFVSNVSHELRTPISNLTLYTQLLTRKPERLDEYCAVISHETRRLSSIIESLLVLSRMDQSRVEVRFSDVSLNQLASEFTSDRKLLAEQQELELDLKIEADLPHVIGDQDLIEQALSILLTNAFNYTPKGGEITIQTHTCHINNRQWSGISVNDTGVGISPDDQQQLFSRFFRGDAGIDMGVPGTGLGLAIAKGIMDLHHGLIEVESTGIPGEGTRFSLWLPIAQ